MAASALEGLTCEQIAKRLKGNQHGWAEKLSLGQSVWRAEGSVLPHRERLLLEWLLRELLTAANRASDASNVPAFTSPDMWLFLAELLKTQTPSDRSLLAPSTFLQAIAAVFSPPPAPLPDARLVSAVQECFTLLYTQGGAEAGQKGGMVSATAIPKIDTFLAFVVAITECARRGYVEGSSNESLESFCILAWATLASLQRRQPNQRKWFALLTSKVMWPALRLRQSLLNVKTVKSFAPNQSTEVGLNGEAGSGLDGDHERVEPVNTKMDRERKRTSLLRLVENTLRSGLFHTEHLPDYSSAFSPSVAAGCSLAQSNASGDAKKGNKKNMQSYPRQLFEKLREVCDGKPEHETPENETENTGEQKERGRHKRRKTETDSEKPVKVDIGEVEDGKWKLHDDWVCVYKSAPFLFSSFARAVASWGKVKNTGGGGGKKEEGKTEGEKEKEGEKEGEEGGEKRGPVVRENYRAMGFGFFLEMCDVMGVGGTDGSGWKVEGERLGWALEAVSDMIPDLQAQGVYNPTDDVVTSFLPKKATTEGAGKGRQSVSTLVIAWADGFTQSLLGLSGTCPFPAIMSRGPLNTHVHGCMRSLLRLSHVVVDGRLGEVWRYLWRAQALCCQTTEYVPTQPSTTPQSKKRTRDGIRSHPPTDLPNLDVGPVSDLAGDVIGTYQKLRQMDRLLGEMFPNLEGGDGERGYVGQRVLERFESCVSLLQPGELPPLFEKFHTELSTKYLPKFQISTASKTKTPPEILISSLEYICALYGSLARSVVMTEGGARSLRGSIEKTMKEISLPLLNWCKENGAKMSPAHGPLERILFVSLRLYHSLNEAIFLQRLVLAKPLELSLGSEIILHLANAYFVAPSNVSLRVIYVLAVLVMQRLRVMEQAGILLASGHVPMDIDPPTVTAVCSDMARLLLTLEFSLSPVWGDQNMNDGWNGDPAAINGVGEFSVAFWKLLCEHIPTLHGYLPPGGVGTFSNILVITLCRRLHETDQSSVTLHGISLGLLASADFCELREMQGAVLRDIWEKVATLMQNRKQSNQSDSVEIPQSASKTKKPQTPKPKVGAQSKIAETIRDSAVKIAQKGGPFDDLTGLVDQYVALAGSLVGGHGSVQAGKSTQNTANSALKKKVPTEKTGISGENTGISSEEDALCGLLEALRWLPIGFLGSDVLARCRCSVLALDVWLHSIDQSPSTVAAIKGNRQLLSQLIGLARTNRNAANVPGGGVPSLPLDVVMCLLHTARQWGAGAEEELSCTFSVVSDWLATLARNPPHPGNLKELRAVSDYFAAEILALQVWPRIDKNGGLRGFLATYGSRLAGINMYLGTITSVISEILAAKTPTSNTLANLLGQSSGARALPGPGSLWDLIGQKARSHLLHTVVSLVEECESEDSSLPSSAPTPVGTNQTRGFDLLIGGGQEVLRSLSICLATAVGGSTSAESANQNRVNSQLPNQRRASFEEGKTVGGATVVMLRGITAYLARLAYGEKVPEQGGEERDVIFNQSLRVCATFLSAVGGHIDAFGPAHQSEAVASLLALIIKCLATPLVQNHSQSAAALLEAFSMLARQCDVTIFGNVVSALHKEASAPTMQGPSSLMSGRRIKRAHAAVRLVHRLYDDRREGRLRHGCGGVLRKTTRGWLAVLVGLAGAVNTALPLADESGVLIGLHVSQSTLRAASAMVACDWLEIRTPDVTSLLELVILMPNPELVPAEKAPVLFDSGYHLAHDVIRRHPEAVYPCVHLMLAAMRSLLKQAVYHVHHRPIPVEGEEQPAEPFPVLCLENMARLYEVFASHKVAFSKYSPYVIADYVNVAQTSPLPPDYKNALLPGIYALLNLCGEHEISLLHACLDTAGRLILKGLHADYETQFKYTGKY